MRSEKSFTEILPLLITSERGTCVLFYGNDTAPTTSTIKIRKGQQWLYRQHNPTTSSVSVYKPTPIHKR